MAYNAAGPGITQRTIDFAVITESFNLLVNNWKTLLIPGVIMLLLFAPGMIIAYLPLITMSLGRGQPATDPFATMGLQLILTLGASIIVLFLYPGIAKYTLNVSRGMPASTSDLWEGFRDPLGYFAVIFISGVVAALGIIGCGIGVIFTAGLMMFALPIKVATGVTASEAVSQSWALLKKDWLMAGLFYFVVSLIAQLGSVACYVGMAFTMPLLYITPVLLYNRYVGYTEPTPEYGSGMRSPYPRPGHPGYGAPPQRDIGEEGAPPSAPQDRPTPPAD